MNENTIILLTEKMSNILAESAGDAVKNGHKKMLDPFNNKIDTADNFTKKIDKENLEKGKAEEKLRKIKVAKGVVKARGGNTAALDRAAEAVQLDIENRKQNKRELKEKKKASLTEDIDFAEFLEDARICDEDILNEEKIRQDGKDFKDFLLIYLK